MPLCQNIGGVNKYTNYLIGDILSISTKEILILFVISIVVIITWIGIFNKLLALSINKTLAKTKGVKAIFIENIFAILIAVVVMISIKWVGILLVNALIILPAAASRNISRNMREYTIYAIIMALVSGIFGLLISFVLEMATGPTIVMISTIIYFSTYMLRKK